MHIKDYLDVHKLNEHIQNGYVHVKHHPTLPLVLYTYAKKCIFEDMWDDVTCRTRGVIVDDLTGTIIARPFEKFFNLDTPGRIETYLSVLGRLPSPLITEKMDGSLGTFWYYKGHSGIATKGSFISEHAAWANVWLTHTPSAYNAMVAWAADGYTPVVEIICEGVQHHVVHYGQDRLVLLAIIDNETGRELPYMQLQGIANFFGVEVVKAHRLDIEGASRDDRENAEGYVASWPRTDGPPLRVKIKHDTFLRHQRILHSATPKHIFELIKSGDRATLAEWYQVLPVPIKAYVESVEKQLRAEYSAIFRRVHIMVHEGLQQFTTRKEFALAWTSPEKRPYASICFSILDQSEKYKDTIWKLVWQRLEDDLKRTAELFQDTQDDAEVELSMEAA